MKHNLLNIILLIFLSTANLKAETLEGVIVNHPQLGTCLNTLGQQIILKSDNTIIRSIINRLKTGDYMSAVGRIFNNRFIIEDIKFVGLKKILGPWISQSHETYRFESFSDLQLIPSKNTLNIQTPLKFTYSIIPGKSHNWSVVFLNNKHVQLGRLIYVAESNNFTIEILNPDTGSILKKIFLNRPASTLSPTEMTPVNQQHTH